MKHYLDFISKSVDSEILEPISDSDIINIHRICKSQDDLGSNLLNKRRQEWLPAVEGEIISRKAVLQKAKEEEALEKVKDEAPEPKKETEEEEDPEDEDGEEQEEEKEESDDDDEDESEGDKDEFLKKSEVLNDLYIEKSSFETELRGIEFVEDPKYDLRKSEVLNRLESIDNLIKDLEKGKKYEIGQISEKTGLKKVAEGKWVDTKTRKEVKSGEDLKLKDLAENLNESRVKTSELLESVKNSHTSRVEGTKVTKEEAEKLLKIYGLLDVSGQSKFNQMKAHELLRAYEKELKM